MAGLSLKSAARMSELLHSMAFLKKATLGFSLPWMNWLLNIVGQHDTSFLTLTPHAH
ncbi:hypothetical protein P245_22985 [Comamonas thiooxydans]|uniref:Uncharacterized protein n=1 Tax=Comamonas thiooxydans TaxID=363952 RepID=A0A0E3B9R3_9BURK|nr:hypothetical protein P245_22985 [Comamonas thiooxydans]